MTLEAAVWIVLFCAAALLFFGLAAIIAVLGFKDLRSLLRKSETVSPTDERTGHTTRS